MTFENNATRIRRTLMIELARRYLRHTLDDDVDNIPVEQHPRRGRAVRCCTHHDRAVTRYRLMALLGHAVENETDELKPLREYAAEAQARSEAPAQVLTVIDEACSACVPGNYFITNACRGCVARPCTLNCPKNAIDVVDGEAKIDREACIDCGKCMQVCPYHAIIYVPIPCEEACPVGAIRKDASGREQIDSEACIHCGKCVTTCPFGAIMEVSQLVDVLAQLRSGKRVVAMLAPALAGHLPAELEKVNTALRRLGFADVLEVAAGADHTAREEAAEFVERMEDGDALMTTSCCPAYVAAVERHVPAMKPFVSSTPTPMHFAGKVAKSLDPGCITVFIGPCIAKREEAHRDAMVDYVLTAEEIGAIFVAAEIEVAACPPTPFPRPARRTGRGFALSGGVTGAVAAHVRERVPLKPMSIDGLTSKTMKLLKVYAKGKGAGNFLEVMCCEGGCVAGPCSMAGLGAASKRITDYANAGASGEDLPTEEAGSMEEHVLVDERH